MRAAQATDSPVLLQLTRSSIDYMGLKNAVVMARQAISDYGVEGWVHLDHGGGLSVALALVIPLVSRSGEEGIGPRHLNRCYPMR